MGGAPRVDILCDGNDKIGFGHIRRSQTLAAQLMRDGVSVRFMGSSVQSNFMLSIMAKAGRVPTITIFDTPLDIDDEINLRAKQGQLIIALDYFGNSLPDVSIAVFAHQEVRAKRAVYVGFEYILIRDEIFGLRGGGAYSERSDRVLVMVGGGDIRGQSHLAAQALAQAGCTVTLIQGPYAVSLQRYSNYEVCTNPSNLPELFAGCDWAVTSGGGSLFEGLCLGKAVHVLPQTAAEGRIAQYVFSQGGLLGIGLDSLRAYSVNEVVEVAAKGAHLVDGLGAQRVSQIVRSWL